jgi:hypothetical protein
MSEAEARTYPDLIQIVEEKVKPERLKQKDKGGQEKWWQFLRPRNELTQAIAPLERVLVISCQATTYVVFTFLPPKMVFSHALAVFAYDQYHNFAILSSRIHKIWTRFFGSSLEERLRYTPSDCFETFPFPIGGELEEIGREYYQYRAELMVKNNQGLTDTYNRFHDPYERDPALYKLRELHSQLDRAVLKAYGWSDIDPSCGFTLEYLDIETDGLPEDVQQRISDGNLYFPSIEEASDFNSIVFTGKRRLPWRYRWPQSTHDEVLARLLDLNKQRAETQIETKPTKPKSKKTSQPKPGQIELFD